MPKRVFWPVSMIVMGLIFLASNIGLLPRSFWNLWPLILIAVGLGALVTSDRDEWMVDASSSAKNAAAGGSGTHSSTKAKASSKVKPTSRGKSVSMAKTVVKKSAPTMSASRRSPAKTVGKKK